MVKLFYIFVDTTEVVKEDCWSRKKLRSRRKYLRRRGYHKKVELLNSLLHYTVHSSGRNCFIPFRLPTRPAVQMTISVALSPSPQPIGSSCLNEWKLLLIWIFVCLLVCLFHCQSRVQFLSHKNNMIQYSYDKNKYFFPSTPFDGYCSNKKASQIWTVSVWIGKKRVWFVYKAGLGRKFFDLFLHKHASGVRFMVCAWCLLVSLCTFCLRVLQ